MNPRQKVAIIGGGMGALSTAWFLTDPAHGGRYEVTIHTMGWRLGGKGASGRDADRYDRILEHGLHIWFGTYHNAIAMMRACYTELGRPPCAPLARFDDAFKGQNRLVLTERVNGGWQDWGIEFPSLPETPGGSTAYQLINRLLHLIGTTIERLPYGLDRTLTGVLGSVTSAAAHLLPGPLRVLARAIWLCIGARVHDDNDLRRAWTVIYLAITVVRGMIADDVPARGFHAIDDLELRAWLQNHSSFDEPHATPDRLAYWSAGVQAFYDASFSYQDGDVRRPNIAAGVGLRSMLRILFDYSGSIIREMQAGMGEAVFAPLYQVLQARGVRFQFFRRMTGLTLDSTEIVSVNLSAQVRMKTDYRPLVRVRDLDCWPSKPLFDQIEDGDALRASGANLEHWFSDWTDTGGTVALTKGQDFDCVVLAISHAVLPRVTESLRINPAWSAMLDGLTAIATQATQLWFSRDRAALGRGGAPEVIGGYNEPWSSLTDFSHLLARENWPAGNTPGALFYSCGAMPAEGDDAAVYERLRTLLTQQQRPIWPAIAGPAGIDWTALWAPADITGEDRLKQQYWRANTDPTERYVLSLAGETGRLRADATGFGNLVIAGEWTDTHVNISSIETTTMSGMRAARAIAGTPMEIIGETDF